MAARIRYPTLIKYKVVKANGVKLRKNNAKIIVQYDLAGNFIQAFFGSEDAEKWLLDYGCTSNSNAKAHIKQCCINKEKSAYGYKWQYLPNPQ